MRITCVIGPFLPVPPALGGAVERTFLALCEEYAARGHEVTMISRRYRDFPRDETVRGVRHIRIPSFDAPKSKPLYRLLDVIYALRACQVLPQSDVTITHSVSLPLFIPKTRAGAVYVNVARFPKGHMGFYQRADRLQPVSNAIAEAVIEQSPAMAPRVKMIHSPLSHVFSDAIRNSRGPREKRIVYLGRIAREKGVELAIGAFANLAEQFPDWSLEIIGPWEHNQAGDGPEYLAELKALAQGPAADRISFAGPIYSQETLVERMRGAELFVYPSLAEKGEAFGIAPLEAMACGCATIVSGLECFQDFVRDGVNGVIFDHRANALANMTAACARLMSDEAERNAFGLAAMNSARNFSPSVIADRMLLDFAELTAQAQPKNTRAAANAGPAT
ncbi:MAG: glycosyltransferase family 4 protein [Terricaulis sp.]